MRRKIVRITPVNAIKKMRSTYLIPRLLLIAALLCGYSFAGRAQSAPTFLNGTTQTFAVCENDTNFHFGSLLGIIDPDAGDTETWTIDMAASHGTLTGFPFVATSTGAITTPDNSIYYLPDPGFSGVDSFRIAVSDGTGTDYTTIIVSVNPPPVLDNITGPSSVCVGATIVLSDDSLGGYWTASNTFASVGSSTGIVTGGGVPGMDTIFYSDSNSCGLTTVSVNVTVTLLPDPGFIFGPNHVCPAATITLFETVPGGTWSASNSNATVSLTGDVTGMTTGVDTIFYSVTLACGTAVASYPVTIDAFPIAATITGPSTVCVGSTITLSASIAGGNWFRLHSAIDSVGQFTGVVTGFSVGNDSIIYHIVNGCGTADAYHTVTVNPLPVSGTITGLDSVCVLGSITLIDAAPGGSWTVSNAHASISSGGVVTGLTGGLDTARYTVVNTCGIAISQKPFTVVPLPNAGLITGPDSSVCVNDSIFMVDPTALGPGTWSMLNPNATINSAGKVTGMVAGLDTIKFVYTNACGSAFTTKAITVNPLPYAGIIRGRDSICAGSVIVLTDSIPGGTWSTASTLASVAGAGTTAAVTGIAAGVATVTYSYTNMCGTLIATHRDTVIALPDSGVIVGPSAVCTGASVTLVDTSTGGTWTSSSSGASVTGGVVSGVTAGVVSISYSVTNVCRTAVATHTVTVNTIPSPGTIVGDTAICPDVLVTLTNSVPGGVWSVSNDTLLIDASGVVSGVRPGHATVSYTVTNACGTAHTTFTITILPYAICWHTYVNPVTMGPDNYNIYPNPATDELVIKIDQGAYSSFIITNQLGQTMLKQALSGLETNVNLQSLTPGLYNITLIGEGGAVTRKMIKQ